jgi:hypothetical protein
LSADDERRRVDPPPRGPGSEGHSDPSHSGPGSERRTDPARRPPSLSTPTSPHWNPFGTAVAVFTAVAIPIVVVGYTRDAGPSTVIIVLGVVIGLIAGLIAGLWVDSRGGQVWRGPRL